MSNQVFRDPQNGIPYHGEVYQFNATFVGDQAPFASVTIAIRSERLSNSEITLCFDTTQAVDFGATSTTMVCLDGTIPPVYRPDVNKVFLVPLPQDIDPFSPQLIRMGYLIVNTAGGMILRRILTSPEGLSTPGQPGILGVTATPLICLTMRTD